MIEGTIEKPARDIGFDLACNGSDTAQADLIYGLAQGFASYSQRNPSGFAMQLAYMCKAWRDTKPTREERHCIEELCEYLIREIREQEQKV